MKETVSDKLQKFTDVLYLHVKFGEDRYRYGDRRTKKQEFFVILFVIFCHALGVGAEV